MCRLRLAWLGSFVALVAVGCGSVTSNSDGGGGGGGGAAGTTGTAGTLGTGGGSGTTGAGGAGGVCAFASTYTILDGGGLVAMSDTATLTPPNAFHYAREFFRQDAGPQSCDPAMPACGDAAKIDVRDVEAAIAHPDVQAALAMATAPTYGNRGVADGPSFNFTRADGRGFHAGLSCDTPSTTCTPIPPGVSALAQLLRDLIRQQRMDAACAAIAN
jgi:hypothetical protein